MVHMSLLDDAIKSFVEIPKYRGSRIIYSRTEILSRRFCKAARQRPPVFDERSAMLGYKRIYYGTGFKADNERKFENRKQCCSQQFKTTLEEEFNDDAIVYISDSHVRFWNNRRSKPYESGYDSNVRLKYVLHPKYEASFVNEPEWYVHAPNTIDENMEASELSIKDDEKENYRIYTDIAEPVRRGGIEKFENLGVPQNTAAYVYRDKEKSERPLNIKTLREIESKLNIPRIVKDHESMSAYYKLLGLIEGATQKRNNAPIADSIDQRKKREHSSNRVYNEFGSAHLLSDPAVTQVVEGRSDSIEAEIPFKAIVNSEPIEVNGVKEAEHIPYSPLAVSYHRQVMATSPFGQNALRWFKAMTNAASANACISQQIDAASSSVVGTNRLGDETNKYEIRTDRASSGLSERTLENAFANKSNDMKREFNNFGLTQSLGLPLCLSPTEQMMTSAMSLGMNMCIPNRPIKPLMFYYQPNSTNLFGRPVIHPFLLQQFVQRQMELRNTMLHLSYNQPRINDTTYNNDSHLNTVPYAETENIVQSQMTQQMPKTTSRYVPLSTLIHEIHSKD